MAPAVLHIDELTSLLLDIVLSGQAIGYHLIPSPALLQHSEPFVEPITHLFVSRDLLAKEQVHRFLVDGFGMVREQCDFLCGKGIANIQIGFPQSTGIYVNSPFQQLFQAGLVVWG